MQVDNPFLLLMGTREITLHFKEKEGNGLMESANGKEYTR